MVRTSRNPLVNIVNSLVSLSFPHITGKTSILDELNKPHPPCLNPGIWALQPRNTEGQIDVTIILRSLAWALSTANNPVTFFGQLALSLSARLFQVFPTLLSLQSLTLLLTLLLFLGECRSRCTVISSP